MNILNEKEVRTERNIKKYDSVIIYGVGSHICEVISYLKKIGIKILSICDSNSKKFGNVVYDYIVENPGDALKKYIESRTAILIGVCSWQREIWLGLTSDFGIRDEDVFSYHTDYSNDNMYSYEDIYNNIDLINKTYDLLSDSESKILFENLINNRITRKPSYLITNPSMKRPYVYVNSNDSIFPKGVCVDAGAFTGDTAELFCSMPEVDEVICIEPLLGNYKEIEGRFNNSVFKSKVSAIHMALGKIDGTINLYYDYDISVSASLDEADRKQYETVPIHRIDTILGDRKRVDYIKFDIEGAEVDALVGGMELLHRCHPSLMVSAYHYTRHLWEIPILVKQEFPEARIYLGHQMNASFEPEYYIVL